MKRFTATDLATFLLTAAIVAAPATAPAYYAGGGKDAQKGNDCLIGFDSFFDASDITLDGKKQIVECTDCDPACDTDGVAEPNGSCTFDVGVCVNQGGVEGCTPPAALDKATAKGKVKGVKGAEGKVVIDATQLLTGSVCGAHVDAVVPTLEKKGAPTAGEVGLQLSAMVKKNKAEGTKTRKDQDKVKVRCLPRPDGEACPAVTTTSTVVSTTVTSTTTTTSTTVPLSVCPNEVVEETEECDDGNLDPTDGCTKECTICGNGTTTAPETCDDTNLVSGDGCDANCRTTGCGNELIVGDETCDDGNTDDDDACPSDCIVDQCAPQSGTDFTVNVNFAGSENVAGITVLVDYPEGKVSIPGSGASVPTGIITDLPGFAFGQTNDLDHALIQVVVDAGAFPSGLLHRIHFETCADAPAPTGGEFTCTVTTAGDASSNPISGVTCSIELPS